MKRIFAGRFAVRHGDEAARDPSSVHATILSIVPGWNDSLQPEDFFMSVDEMRDLRHVIDQTIRITERGSK